VVPHQVAIVITKHGNHFSIDRDIEDDVGACGRRRIVRCVEVQHVGAARVHDDVCGQLLRPRDPRRDDERTTTSGQNNGKKKETTDFVPSIAKKQNTRNQNTVMNQTTGLRSSSFTLTNR
jgi:hypothetical protein